MSGPSDSGGVFVRQIYPGVDRWKKRHILEASAHDVDFRAQGVAAERTDEANFGEEVLQ